jgi:conjugative relaxase-like TrwC/TraI family protein
VLRVTAAPGHGRDRWWSAVMSLHKLSAGAGVDYLLKHTCCADVEREIDTPLSAYYVDAGYPPGRWLGAGLDGLDGGRGIAGPVDEQGMTRLFALGLDPASAAALGRNWAVPKDVSQRIAERVAVLPVLSDGDRVAAVARIEAEEAARRMPVAVTGFDLTLTVPKSVSVLWALADPSTQTRIATAHRDAVEDCLRLIEADALFTRVGAGGAAQVTVVGAIAAAFDHWDTRTGDPNLHTHLVISNKVQGVDGRWRSIDATALYAATVAVSEIYDCLIADAVSQSTGAGWSLRDRGARRSPAFEIDGIHDDLLSEFSTRSTQVQATLRVLLEEFRTANGRTPSRVEMLRMRQLATRKSRPAKQLRALPELLADWRARAALVIAEPLERLVGRVFHVGAHAGRFNTVDAEVLQSLAATVVDAVSERRSTWTPWNLIAEAARACKTLRMATPADRIRLVEHVAQLAIDAYCLQLTPPDLIRPVEAFARVDGRSVFRRHRAEVFTSPQILAAEHRLLEAANASNGPRIGDAALASVVQTRPSHVALAADQVAAIQAIATSGRGLDVLVGPAGSGKTTTLHALRSVWEETFGTGSVIGLAPSATAAAELADALGIACENTAKWLHETTRPAPTEVDEPYRLRAGQLLIVDEASLADTRTLDILATQAGAVGAKLLLVGDHRQLSSVDAGGAFGLLATETRAVELTSLWRFRHDWEAAAGQQLRVGDPTCLNAYAAHGRLHEGPAEVMTADAYTAWDTAVRAGKTAVLIAADTATVTELNTQARAARVTAGVVESGGARLHDATVVGVGDTIVTRTNRRDLRTSTGAWVRNGDLWTVTARDPGGALTVQRAGREGDRHPARSVVCLPAAYVAAHVELGYATTAHRAQGITVDAAFAILRPGVSREVAYVALTRGRTDNQAFIATDIPDPTYDGAPAPAQTGPQVMAAILANVGAQLSATQTLRVLQDGASSLAQLAPIHETLVHTAQQRHWADLITSSALTAEQTHQVLASAAYGPLVAALRRLEHDGYDTDRVLPALVAAAPLGGAHDDADGDPAPARDVAAVLHHRVSRWHDYPTWPRDYPFAGLIGGLIVPANNLDTDTPRDQRDAINQLEDLMRARVKTLTQQAISTPAPWLRELGDAPRDRRQSAYWIQAVGVIAAYRDRYNIPDYADHLGYPGDRDPDRAVAYQRAIDAHRQARTITYRPLFAHGLAATQQISRGTSRSL